MKGDAGGLSGFQGDAGESGELLDGAGDLRDGVFEVELGDSSPVRGPWLVIVQEMSMRPSVGMRSWSRLMSP
jgi:hypothetical protein